MSVLKIENLTVEVQNKTVLKDFSLTIKTGEIHAIMGPNGTGKSTLARVLASDDTYKITKGKIYLDDEDITDYDASLKAKLGIFLGMQMPPEIEGVSNADFLRTALHAKEGDNFKLLSFIKELDKVTDELKMNKDMIHRGINQGFSGGERKKNEILQMLVLKPKIVILDEIDSGLDVDSLKLVGKMVMDYFRETKPAIILITHYQRLLDYIKPDFVHVMYDGNIKVNGDNALVKKLEAVGYDNLIKEAKDSTNKMKEIKTHE